MKNKIKKVSPAIFGVAIICFFLPFMEVSCGGQKVMSFSAIQMVVGTTVQQPGMLEESMSKMPSLGIPGEETRSQKVGPEPFAIITFLCTIIGLQLSFIRNRKSAVLPAISAGIGAITLLMLRSKITNDVLREGGGMLQVEYVFGFWVILILLIADVGLNLYVFSGDAPQKIGQS